MKRVRRAGIGLISIGLILCSNLTFLSTVSALSLNWNEESTTSPAYNNYLYSDDCVNTNFCVAVGGDTSGSLAEMQSGSGWQVSNSVNPSGYSNPQLNSVSCTAISFCMTVGIMSYQADTGVLDQNFAEEWDGNTWALSNTQNNSNDNHLYGISCASQSFCIAVGNYDNNNQFPYSSLAEVWNGSNWSVTPSLSPGTANDTLFTVRCLNANFCMAAGEYSNDGGTYYPLFEEWNGSSWSSYESSIIGSIQGISCVSTSFCIGVGQSNNNTLVYQWDGANWSVVSSPNPPNTSDFKSVSCTSNTACVAVGKYEQSGSNNENFTEYWDGSNWNFGNYYNQGTSAAFNGVSCVIEYTCVAVGNVPDNNGNPNALIVGSITPTSVNLTSSLNPSMYGSSVTFTAVVTPTDGNGTVQFSSDNSTISGCGAEPLYLQGSEYVTTCSTNALSLGQHNISAVYSGDLNFQGSSAALTQNVSQAITNTTVSSSSNPSSYRSAVTFIASVGPSDGGGTVNFEADGSTISGCSNIPLNLNGPTSYTAKCTTNTLSIGQNTINAVYSGDNNYLGSTSNNFIQTVDLACFNGVCVN